MPQHNTHIVAVDGEIPGANGDPDPKNTQN